MSMLYTLLPPFYPIIAHEKGCPVWLLGIAFAMDPAFTFLTSPFVGAHLSKIGHKRAYFIGINLGALALFFEGLSTFFEL